MNHMRKAAILATLALLLLLAGCRAGQEEEIGNDEVPLSDQMTMTSMRQLVLSKLEEQYTAPQDIRVESELAKGGVTYLAFSFTADVFYYYGFAAATYEEDEPELLYFESYPNFPQEPIVITQFIGTQTGAEVQRCHITAGYVNEESIHRVELTYGASDVRIIDLEENQSGFLEIQTDSTQPLLEAVCYAQDGSLVYRVDFTSVG